jgi:hypothetical protein
MWSVVMPEIFAPRRGVAVVDLDGVPSLVMAQWMEAINKQVNATFEVTEVDMTTLADGIQPTVTTVVDLYTAPLGGAGTTIIAFTATNSTVTTATYNTFVVPTGGTADDTNKLIDVKSLAQSVTDVPAEVQNQLIPPGGTLAVQVSVGTTIAFRATGIVVAV